MTSTSPYNVSDSIEIHYPDGEYSVERLDKRASLKDSGIIHTVMEGETLQNIANKYYGDSGRWGDIATFNDIIDPLDIEHGMVLQIPS